MTCVKNLYLCFCLFCLGILQSQNAVQPLQNFSNPALFNLNDNTCLNLNGEWIGEETEWIDQTDKIKGKYQIKFSLTQQGNKVSGNSFISFDEGRSFGTFNIRGMVLGNKLYFEEYAIQQQQFAQANVAWCLRTGELDITNDETNNKLEGANYKGYATDYFFDCKAKVAMSLSNPLKAKTKNVDNTLDKNTIQSDDKTEMRLYPNPADKEVNVVFKIANEEQVHIDIYTFTGEFVANIINEKFEKGTHQKLFNLNDFIAGVYLVRMQAGKLSQAGLLVISR